MTIESGDNNDDDNANDEEVGEEETWQEAMEDAADFAGADVQCSGDCAVAHLLVAEFKMVLVPSRKTVAPVLFSTHSNSFT